ncbi:coiled-coil domain-containing 58 [Dermatophagoides farinae]|uniref:Protein MIX23 n=1 Tax=Dermatophagoides farinae TaxID=6954 RepID=A0A922L8P8_DERFA|nr:protein MIX23-like [Dermatophagoides farinae]KAH7639508.1 coiled-coil domain-containing protein 58-like [Dermatophagoides farinae]KAH9521832.1 Coiled-coil domain-containing protein 58 [Dermatophagoides farinae]
MEAMCEDFLAFEDVLKNLRKLDDNIVHSLNTTIPTQSFAVKGIDPTKQCQELYKQLMELHTNREQAIKNCIIRVSESVHQLKRRRDENEADFQVQKQLRKEQNKLRMMQNELHVEEVVRDRSLKFFHERCRAYYRPATSTPPI